MYFKNNWQEALSPLSPLTAAVTVPFPLPFFNLYVVITAVVVPFFPLYIFVVVVVAAVVVVSVYL